MTTLNPRLYPETTRLHLDEGVLVHYRLGPECAGFHAEGDGIVELIWLSIGEIVDIRKPDGSLVRADLTIDEVKPVVDD